MNGLILYLGPGVRLQAGPTAAAVRSLPGVRLRAGTGLSTDLMEAEFDVARDSTIVRLQADLETISMSGTGEASLVAAWELSRRIHAPLHVVDWNYAFDLDMSVFTTYGGFVHAVERASSE